MKSWIFLTAIVLILVSGKKYYYCLAAEKSLKLIYKNTYDSLKPSLENVKSITNQPGRGVLEISAMPHNEKSKKTIGSLGKIFQKNHQKRSKRQINKVSFGPLLHFLTNKWQCLREQILGGNFSLDTLQRYAELAMALLECVYDNGSISVLLFNLQTLWYDNPELYLPNDLRAYITHLNLMYEYNMVDDVDRFINQLELNLNGNLDIILPGFHSVLNTHVVDSSLNESSFDYFIYFRENALNYFFIFHVNESFRVLFVILELLERNVTNGKNNYFRDDVSNVPEEILEILKNNTAYSIYLLNKKHKELSLVENDNNQFKGRLQLMPRVNDPDLIFLLWNRIKNHLKTLTNTDDEESNSKEMNKLQEYEESSKEKGKFSRRPSEKYYFKRQKIDHKIDDENPSTSGSQTSPNSKQRPQTQEKYIGQCNDSMSDDELQQLLLDVPKSCTYSDISSLENEDFNSLEASFSSWKSLNMNSSLTEDEEMDHSQTFFNSWQSTSSSEDEVSDKGNGKFSRRPLKKWNFKKSKTSDNFNNKNPSISGLQQRNKDTSTAENEEMDSSQTFFNSWQNRHKDTSSSEDEESGKGNGKILRRPLKKLNLKKFETSGNYNKENPKKNDLQKRKKGTSSSENEESENSGSRDFETSNLNLQHHQWNVSAEDLAYGYAFWSNQSSQPSQIDIDSFMKAFNLFMIGDKDPSFKS